MRRERQSARNAGLQRKPFDDYLKGRDRLGLRLPRRNLRQGEDRIRQRRKARGIGAVETDERPDAWIVLPDLDSHRIDIIAVRGKREIDGQGCAQIPAGEKALENRRSSVKHGVTDGTAKLITHSDRDRKLIKGHQAGHVCGNARIR